MTHGAIDHGSTVAMKDRFGRPGACFGFNVDLCSVGTDPPSPTGATQAQPSCANACPSFQIFVICVIFPPANSIA